MDGFKIQELRAAVLNDLREFIPKDYYKSVHTDEDVAYGDITLSKRLQEKQYKTPQLTPRQLAAVWLLERIGLYCHKYESADPAADAAEGITPESIKEMSLEHLHDALTQYTKYLPAHEAKALSDTPAAVVQAAHVDKQVPVQRQQDDAILKWLKDNKHDPLKLQRGEKGKPDVKKDCRDAVSFSSQSVFRTAWDRLRANGEIKDA